jgi:hypothetical protein
VPHALVQGIRQNGSNDADRTNRQGAVRARLGLLQESGSGRSFRHQFSNREIDSIFNSGALHGKAQIARPASPSAATTGYKSNTRETASNVIGI